MDSKNDKITKTIGIGKHRIEKGFQGQTPLFERKSKFEFDEDVLKKGLLTSTADTISFEAIFTDTQKRSRNIQAYGIVMAIGSAICALISICTRTSLNVHCMA